jgi:hypothetical protein
VKQQAKIDLPADSIWKLRKLQASRGSSHHPRGSRPQLQAFLIARTLRIHATVIVTAPGFRLGRLWTLVELLIPETHDQGTVVLKDLHLMITIDTADATNGQNQ